MSFCVILTAAPSISEARKISRELIKNKAAACVSMVPSVESHFRWKGKTEKAKETLLIIKTTKQNFRKAERLISECHSYDTPEIISLAINQGSRKYLRWILNSV